VNGFLVVCLFVTRRLDSNESKEDGDYSTKDEDEECFDIARPGKPSFKSYPIPVFMHIYMFYKNA
jgi:hypothetical protein